MFTLVCSFTSSRKRRETFHEISMIRCYNTLRTDRCQHGSVYHSNGLWQLEINRRLQILVQKSVAVLWHCYHSKDKIPRALKRFVCKLLWFLLRRRFCRQNWYYAQLNTSSISRYFLWPCLKKPERENREVEQACGPASRSCESSLPANKWKTEGKNAHSSWL